MEEVSKPDTVPENRTGYWRKVQEIPREKCIDLNAYIRKAKAEQKHSI